MKKVATLKLVMLRSKYDIILKAINKAKKEVHPQEITDSRALELIAADYLSKLIYLIYMQELEETGSCGVMTMILLL